MALCGMELEAHTASRGCCMCGAVGTCVGWFPGLDMSAPILGAWPLGGHGGGGGVTLLAGHAIMLHSLHAHASGPPHGPSAGAVASARLTGRSSSSGQAARRGGWWRQRHVAQSAKGRLMQHAQRRQFSAAQVADASPRHRSSSRCSRYASMRMPISDQRAGCGSSITAQRSAQRGSSRTGMHAHESPSISSHLSGVGACAAAGQGGWEVLRAVHQTNAVHDKGRNCSLSSTVPSGPQAALPPCTRVAALTGRSAEEGLPSGPHTDGREGDAGCAQSM